jgi:hypothetical protein
MGPMIRFVPISGRTRAVVIFTGNLAKGLAPDVWVLRLDGGDVLAAYLMAAVITDFGLDTHVEGDCVSACAFVFLGGRGRTMGDGARLGFYQTALESPKHADILR